MKSLKLLFDIIAITILLIMPCTKSYSQVYELTSIEKLNTGDEIIIVNENSKVAMENVAISVNPKAISIESMLNEDKTEIHVTSNTNIQWIITKFDNPTYSTYSFNTPGTEYFLRAINTAQGVSVRTKDSKTEDTYSWDNTNSVLKATKAKGITDRYITYSGEKNNDWRAYTSIVNLNPKTIFFKRTKNIANIKFETDNFTIKAGDNFNAPNLIYTEGLTGITYSMECTPMYSSDVPENMATLNKTTGEITLGNIPGTIVVTAYFSGNDTYGKASASYTINILDPDFVPANYSKITSTDQLYADGKYIIICEEYKKALSKISNNYGNAVKINLDNGMVTIDTKNSKDNPYEITLGGKPDAYTFTTLQGKIGWPSDNYLNTSDNQQWEISFDENNNALIDNAANTSTARKLCYNNQFGNTSGPFRVYIQPELYSRVQIYRRNIICVGEEGYATFCNDMAYIMPKGVSGAVITSANTQNGVLTTNYCYPEGSIVPAYTPLLIKALTGTYDFLTVSSTDATKPNDNLLRGCKDIDKNGNTYAGEGNYKYYILSHSKDGERFGFFWAATNGAAITYKAPYAYLAIKTDSSNAPSMFSLDGDEYTTGIINIDNDKVFNNSTKFNISGQRVNKGYKGLIIMNNKKYLSK